MAEGKGVGVGVVVGEGVLKYVSVGGGWRWGAAGVPGTG